MQLSFSNSSAISRLFAIFCFASSFTLNAKAFKKDLVTDSSTLEGRWDLVVNIDGKEFPSWLEVNHSGFRTLTGQYVGVVGSARPISEIIYKEGRFTFSIPPQWDRGTANLVFEGNFHGDAIDGSVISSDGNKYTWTGVRAPDMNHHKTVAWGAPIKLFNGRDLSGWHASGTNQWKAVNGLLVSDRSGSNLITYKAFSDFKLHIEFRYQKGSNSGVYLRGRYEVQIADSKGMKPLKDQLGAIYGFIAPNEMAAKDPGLWQTYDITLIGRLVTVVANGKTIICDQEIPGITGGAMNSREGEPGPILIQGDHGPIDFRNIIITPAK